MTTTGTGTASDPIVSTYQGGSYTNETLTYNLDPNAAPFTVDPTSLPNGSATVLFAFPGYVVQDATGPGNIGKGYLVDPQTGSQDYTLALSYGQSTATLTITNNATGAARPLVTVDNVATVLVDGQWEPENGPVSPSSLVPTAGPNLKGLPLDTGPVIQTDQAGGSTDSATLALSGYVVNRFEQENYNFTNGQVVNISDNGVPVGSATIQSVNIPGTARYLGTNDNAWATSIGLTPGDNAISITTTDSNGLSASTTLDYFYTPPVATGTGDGTSGSTTPASGSGAGAGGTSGAPGPVAPATSADHITFDPDVTFLGHGSFQLTGHAASPAGVGGIELTADIDGAATDLGAATINADGSFSFTDHVGRHTQGFITATLTDGAGQNAAVVAGYALQAGLTGGSFVARQDVYDPVTGDVASISRFRADGSRVVQVAAAGQTLTSGSFDTFLNGGQPDTTFVFNPGPGLDVVQELRLGGADHDTLSLPASDFTSIADVLAHTSQARGAAIIHDPVTGDALRLPGVSKGMLAHNSGVFTLHS